MRKKILLICGSLNQTTQMHQIAEELSDCDLFFTPYYGDLLLSLARRFHLAEFTIMGRKLSSKCLEYLNQHKLALDLEGRGRDYDLILTCSDLVVPKNILNKKVVLVQEGMTDPENLAYHIVKRVPMLPRWLASTAATGISNAFTLIGYARSPEFLLLMSVPRCFSLLIHRKNVSMRRRIERIWLYLPRHFL